MERSRNGCAKVAYSICLPGKLAITFPAPRKQASIVAFARASATMYTPAFALLPGTSTATYSRCGLKATAIEAGIVHGVVVQMMVFTRLPASEGLSFAGSLVSGYFT